MKPFSSSGILGAAAHLALCLGPLLMTCCSPAAPPPALPPPGTAAPIASSAPACGSALPKGEPARLTKEALAKLAEVAKETDTDALVVVDNGHVVLEVGKVEQPIELMSVTKSVVSLVIGQLVDRKLVRLDQPIADFVPAWKGTPKEKIQLLHVLNHTSGLDDKPNTADIYASGDFVKFAIDAELKHPPGDEFFYSNRAANLLAQVVKTAAGVPLDEWARKNLFEPIGISDFGWSNDKAGNKQVMAGVQMSALGLARIGQLVLDDGRACDKQVVSREWLSVSTAYQKVGFRAHGLLWWLEPESHQTGFSAELFERWKKSGMPDDFIAKFRPFEGQYFDHDGFFAAVYQGLYGKAPTGPMTDADLSLWHKMTWESGRPDGVPKNGPVKIIVADGWGGQLLMVYPKEHVVVARLREVENEADAKEKKSFYRLVGQTLFNEKLGK